MGVRVLVVDDSRTMRRAIARMLSSDPSIEVVGEAANGEEALALSESLRPDVVTLDVEMPGLSGLEVLDRLRGSPGVRVIMLSSQTKEGSATALEALRRGAADFVTKEASHLGLHVDQIRDDLVRRVKAVGRRTPHTTAPPASPAPRAASPARLQFRPGMFDLILIGSSTGGPPALETILRPLPPDLTAPIVLAQHMPEMFTRSMAQRLEQECAITVTHAEDGMPLYPGAAYVIPGGRHGRVQRSRAGRWTLDVSPEPAGAPYKPSVNELLRSGAAAGPRCLGVVLTGMGDDGVVGAAALHEAGGLLLTQDEATSVVYGMPRAVAEAGLSAMSLPPEQIGALLRLLATAGPLAAGERSAA